MPQKLPPFPALGPQDLLLLPPGSLEAGGRPWLSPNTHRLQFLPWVPTLLFLPALWTRSKLSQHCNSNDDDVDANDGNDDDSGSSDHGDHGDGDGGYLSWLVLFISLFV